MQSTQQDRPLDQLLYSIPTLHFVPLIGISLVLLLLLWVGWIVARPGGCCERRFPSRSRQRARAVRHLVLFANEGSGDRLAGRLKQHMVSVLSGIPGLKLRAFSMTTEGVAAGIRACSAVAQPASSEDGRLVVVVLGGDGTSAWVLRSMVAAGLRHIPVSLLPCGSGNDLSNSLGWGRVLSAHWFTKEGMMDFLATLEQGERIRLDVWEAVVRVRRGGRIVRFQGQSAKELRGSVLRTAFFNYCSIGTDALLTARAEAQRTPSRLGNRLVFLCEGVRTLSTSIPIQPLVHSFKLDHKQTTINPESVALLFLNSRRYGGGCDMWGIASPLQHKHEEGKDEVEKMAGGDEDTYTTTPVPFSTTTPHTSFPTSPSPSPTPTPTATPTPTPTPSPSPSMVPRLRLPEDLRRSPSAIPMHPKSVRERARTHLGEIGEGVVGSGGGEDGERGSGDGRKRRRERGGGSGSGGEEMGVGRDKKGGEEEFWLADVATRERERSASHDPASPLLSTTTAAQDLTDGRIEVIGLGSLLQLGVAVGFGSALLGGVDRIARAASTKIIFREEGEEGVEDGIGEEGGREGEGDSEIGKGLRKRRILEVEEVKDVKKKKGGALRRADSEDSFTSDQESHGPFSPHTPVTSHPIPVPPVPGTSTKEVNEVLPLPGMKYIYLQTDGEAMLLEKPLSVSVRRRTQTTVLVPSIAAYLRCKGKALG